MNISAEVPIIDRMLVVGPTGAGKSSAARHLSDALDRPLVSLDRLMLDDHGVPKPKEQFVQEAEELFAESQYVDGWVVDGSYRSLRHITWDNADVIGYIRPSIIRNVGLIAWRGATGDTTGGNSDQPVTAQLRRLLQTRRYDLEKLDKTTSEYSDSGVRVICKTNAVKLVSAVLYNDA